MATTTRRALATRSIAPPMPFTILPGIIQFAIAFFVHFHRAEHAQIDVPAANHGKRIGAREIRGAGHLGHRFLAGIDQVGIFFAFDRIRPDAEHSVLRLQHDFHARRHMIGDSVGMPMPRLT